MLSRTARDQAAERLRVARLATAHARELRGERAAALAEADRALQSAERIQAEAEMDLREMGGAA